MTDAVSIEADRLRRVIARRIAAAINLGPVERAEMAAAMNITPTRLSRIAKGSSDISGVELILAARFLGVPVGSLTGEVSPPPAAFRRK